MTIVSLRLAAEHDIERGLSHYLDEAGATVAAAFLEQIDVALKHIQQHPASGSLRYGQLCDVPGLRSWLLTRYPYTVLYMAREAHIDVLRVLHQHADIPAQLSDLT
jgi:toxin ParE1/3/4